MKKTILAVALALFVSGLAGAASLSGFRITAPQPFTVGGTAMPAGVYDVALVSPAGVLEVVNESTHASVLVIGSPITDHNADQPSRATFTPVNGKLALSQVYLPSGFAYGVPAHVAAH